MWLALLWFGLGFFAGYAVPWYLLRHVGPAQPRLIVVGLISALSCGGTALVAAGWMSASDLLVFAPLLATVMSVLVLWHPRS
jgi:hypothetical protein